MSHLASRPRNRNGDVQIARWSRKMFLKNCFSSDGGAGATCGVGEAVGIADGDGIVWAETFAVNVIITANSNRQHRRVRAVLKLNFITYSFKTSIFIRQN